MTSVAACVADGLGGRWNGREWLCHCPLPAHGRGRGDLNPSLGVRDGDRELLVTCHANCDPVLVLAELRRRGLIAPARRRDVDDHVAAQKASGKDLSRVELAIRLWDEGVDPRRTPAEAYLESRGLSITSDLAVRVLRFHPEAHWTSRDGKRGRIPALIAAFRSFDTNIITGVLRIALDQTGAFVDRRMLGVRGGSAIKLDGGEAIAAGLVICEGLESGLSARALGLGSVWTLGSVGAVARFPLISGVEMLIIPRETDDEGKSIAASIECATRWTAVGRLVRLITPRFAGDIDDVRACLARCRQ